MTREELNQHKQQEIIDEQRSERRKKVTLFIFKFVVFFVLSFLLFYLYTTYISTSVLSVKEVRLTNAKIPNSFNGMKIIQFSDLHYGTTVFYDELSEVVSEINKRKPDIVVFTGDLIDSSYGLSIEEQEKIIHLLKKINVKLGKYAVYGEDDDDVFDTIMKQSNFEILNNSYEFIYNEDDAPILINGLGSKINNSLSTDESFIYMNGNESMSNVFTITIAHEPDTVDEVLDKYHTDLFLAGHSHNGNVRIPYFGAIEKIEGAKKYDQEYYRLSDTDLFVSSGIGTNRYGFRLFCRPSINFFRLSNK